MSLSTVLNSAFEKYAEQPAVKPPSAPSPPVVGSASSSAGGSLKPPAPVASQPAALKPPAAPPASPAQVPPPVAPAPNPAQTQTQVPAAAPQPSGQQTQTAPETAASNAQTPAQPPAARRPFDNNFMPALQNMPPEQQRQTVQTAMQEHMAAADPADTKGVQDLHAGNNTPEAEQFRAKVDERGQQVMQENVAQQAQANPELAATPQGFGEMWNNASNMWNSMPQEAQWMVGLGVPIAAVGLMSSLFGEGGAGMGLLGLLGLGAAGLGAASGGLLGQDAQNMSADAMYNVGTFFGAVPEAQEGSLADLKGEDALSRITAAPTFKEQAGALWDPQAQAAKVQQQISKAEQVKKLMMVPEGARPRFLQRIDPSLSYEDAVIAARNATQMAAQMEDPESALAKKLQQGREFVAAPEATANRAAIDAATNAASRAYDATTGAASDAYNNVVNWWKNSMERTHMNIASLIEKWAFNDMDAKELNDLKAQRADGVPYRVEDARRLNELEKRQQVDMPLKKETVIAVCQKAARCWAGYEPVPGAKAYSRGSCRPVGSKKTQKEMKKS